MCCRQYTTKHKTSSKAGRLCLFLLYRQACVSRCICATSQSFSCLSCPAQGQPIGIAPPVNLCFGLFHACRQMLQPCAVPCYGLLIIHCPCESFQLLHKAHCITHIHCLPGLRHLQAQTEACLLFKPVNRIAQAFACPTTSLVCHMHAPVVARKALVKAVRCMCAAHSCCILHKSVLAGQLPCGYAVKTLGGCWRHGQRTM